MNTYIEVNPNDADWNDHCYLYAFGHPATSCPLYLLAWGEEDSALDECIDWLADNKPMMLATEYVNGKIDEVTEHLDSETKEWEDAYNSAVEGYICGGNHGDYLSADMVALVAADPVQVTSLTVADRTFIKVAS